MIRHYHETGLDYADETEAPVDFPQLLNADVVFSKKELIGVNVPPIEGPSSIIYSNQ